MKAFMLITVLSVASTQETSIESGQPIRTAAISTNVGEVCPPDFVFNRVLQVCDTKETKNNFTHESIEERSACTDGNIKQSSDDTGYLICIGSAWRKRLCPTEHVFSAIKVACIPASSEIDLPGCKAGTMKPHSSDTKKFYICINNEWREHSCPDAKFFDKRIYICVHKRESVELVSGECTEGCVRQDTDCCEKFYVCEHGTWTRRTCPDGQYFDPHHQACVIDSTGLCRKTTPKPRPKCEDGRRKQDPETCEKYLECLHGGWIQRPCPKGLVFNPTKQTCIVDVMGICIKRPTTQIPDECTDGRIKRDTECCDKFYCCEDRKWSHRNCPSSQYFDPRQQACVNDIFGFCRKITKKPRVKCEDGCVKQDASACDKYLECVQGEWIQRSCLHGLYFDRSKQACIVDVLGICSKVPSTLKPAECIEGWVKQDSRCCDKFICCEDGTWKRRSCPSGQYFDPQHQACVIDVFSLCRKTTPSPLPKCEDGLVKKDTVFCEKYLECTQGTWVQRACPNGFYFDPSKLTCVVDVTGECIKYPTTQMLVECSDGCVKQDTECCDKFHCCENGNWSRKSCPSGQYFDPQLKACVPDTYGYCRKVTPNPPPKCEDGCVKQDANCCDKYLECVHGQWIQRPCPTGLYYDSRKQACLLDIMGLCTKNSVAPILAECKEGYFKEDIESCEMFYSCENGKWIRRSCPFDQYFEAHSNACVADFLNYCRNRKCKNGYVKQDPNYCDKYLECVHGKWTQRPCPNGLYFDPNKQACAYDTKGVCIQNHTALNTVECPDGCLRQDIECCEKFYFCENGKWIRRSCPSGQYFDPMHQTCIIDTFGHCRKTSTKPWPKCEDGLVRQDRNCCEKYLECVYGEWIHRQCSSGSYFDPKKQACAADVLGVCIGKFLTQSVKCSEGSVKQDNDSCDAFYLCRNGNWMKRTCVNSQYFDPKMEACIVDVFNMCRKH